MLAADFRPSALGHKLDLSPDCFGEPRESNDILGNSAAMQHRMREDGYLFFRNALNRDEVLAAREEILRRIDADGRIDRNHPLMDGVSIPGKPAQDYGNSQNPALAKVLYDGPMMDLHRQLLGGPVRHYDFTWFRAIPGGGTGTSPHADVVYMGRGTWNLHTSWTPIGDIDRGMGGLMLLEGSCHKTDRLTKYWKRDVDTYCVNHRNADEIATGKKWWLWDGWLAQNPVTMRENLGGRWLSTEYRAGDVLIFSVLTVHAGLDNHSNRFRLSSDTRYQLASDPVDERWVSIDGQPPVGHGVAGKRGKIC